MNNRFPILWQTLYNKRLLISVYSLVSMLLLWAFVAMFPSIQEQSVMFEELIKNYPQGFLDAFGISTVGFQTLEQFFAVEQFSIIWPLFTIFFTVSLGAGFFAWEFQTGTMRLILAGPLSRLRVYLERVLAGIIALIVFVTCSIYIVFPLAALHHLSLVSSRYHVLFALCFLFSFAVFGFSVVCSVFFSEKGKVSLLVGGVLLIEYFLQLAARLVDSLGSLQYISLFYYFDFEAALLQGNLSWMSVIIFLVIGFLSLSAGAFLFSKRDV